MLFRSSPLPAKLPLLAKLPFSPEPSMADSSLASLACCLLYTSLFTRTALLYCNLLNCRCHAITSLVRRCEPSHHFRNCEVISWHRQFRRLQYKRAVLVKRAALFTLPICLLHSYTLAFLYFSVFIHCPCFTSGSCNPYLLLSHHRLAIRKPSMGTQNLWSLGGCNAISSSSISNHSTHSTSSFCRVSFLASTCLVYM